MCYKWLFSIGDVYGQVLTPLYPFVLMPMTFEGLYNNIYFVLYNVHHRNHSKKLTYSQYEHTFHGYNEWYLCYNIYEPKTKPRSRTSVNKDIIRMQLCLQLVYFPLVCGFQSMLLRKTNKWLLIIITFKFQGFLCTRRLHYF